MGPRGAWLPILGAGQNYRVVRGDGGRRKSGLRFCCGAGWVLGLSSKADFKKPNRIVKEVP